MINAPIRPPVRINGKNALVATLQSYSAVINTDATNKFAGKAYIYTGTPGWIKVQAESATSYVLSIYSACPCSKTK